MGVGSRDRRALLRATEDEMPEQRFGVWWVQTFHAHYGHAEPIGGKWCVGGDGHVWEGTREEAEERAALMRLAHEKQYEVRPISA